MKTEANNLIEKLNKTFPGVNAVPASQFYSRPLQWEGVWFRGTESCLINGEPVMDWDATINPTLEDFLNEQGWYGEPYDSGTLMAWPI